MKTIDLMHERSERMMVAFKKELAMYVIAGVSGNTGSVVATTLLADKQPVRVIVRDAAKGEPWKAKGAEVVVASLDDRAALARALTGAKGAYLLLPPPAWNATGIAAERARHAEAIIGAVGDARPAHVVLLSSIGANLPSGTGPIQFLHPIENGLRASGVPSTFLRAGAFFENWLGVAKGAIDGGTLYYGLKGDVKFPQVATTDIGRTAARLLVEGPAGVRVVNLAGPTEQSLQDVAAALGAVAGKPIAAVTVPPQAQLDALVGMGASKELASSFVEMTDAINTGRLAWDGSENLVRGTVTLEQRLRELLSK
jgi:uncharacterized protein YbjT (DUF2867 family)